MNATPAACLNNDDSLNNGSGQVLPYATVLGKPLTVLPKDLYIPPDALEVFLEAFSGPLDLLLYLIKKQNINILDIPIAQITAQYMEYVELMKQLQLELAAEYLVMAAMLAEIKSRLLLPKPETTESDEDPRAELVKKLREYERYKKAAEDLDTLPRLYRNVFLVEPELPPIKRERKLPQIELRELMFALQNVLQRASLFTHHHVQKEQLSIRERMVNILSALQANKFISFDKLFNVTEGKLGVVVTFIAILELLRQSALEIVQADSFETIYVVRR